MVKMYSYSRLKNMIYTWYNMDPWFDEVFSYIVLRYKSIENRMKDSFRYVDCNPKNYKVFSHEYSSILRDSGSVFSSLMDRLVRKTTVQSKKETNIEDYRKWLIDKIPNVHLVTVGLVYPVEKRFLLPFHRINYKEGKPEWWTAYNKVKHSDIDSFHDGNLKNALSSLGALAVLYVLIDRNNGSDIQLFKEIGFVTPMRSLTDMYH